jgi:hypothetical protein
MTEDELKASLALSQAKIDISKNELEASLVQSQAKVDIAKMTHEIPAIKKTHRCLIACAAIGCLISVALYFVPEQDYYLVSMAALIALGMVTIANELK